MGSIRSTAGQHVALPARCLVGRSSVCDLMLAALEVSSQHAVLQWNGSLWELQDLGSRNGTFVKDRRLAPGERVQLEPGARIRFARTTGEWSFDDAAPPLPMAVHTGDGRVQLADCGLLMLPDCEQPEFLLHMEEQGRWTVERDGEVEEVVDRALLTVAGEPWRIHLSLGGSGTQDHGELGFRLRDLRLRFAHSHDEEYIELTAMTRGQRIDLHARAHNYVLYLLARIRLADQARGVQPADQGWVQQDKLLDMLKVEATHLNITIHRARLHLAQNGVIDAAGLVERRKGAGQLRLGVSALEIAPV